MNQRTMDEMISYFIQQVEKMNIDRQYKMALLGMITAIGYKNKKQEQRWIPCSERLPEESGQYIITVKYVHVDGYEDLYAEHGEWDGDRWDMFCLGHCGEVEGIIAWMPLPEPYQEDSDG